MTTDYRKFKTPYFDITISDPNGKRSVKLPHHILRLVDKIEFTEVWDNKSGETNMITLTFLEGSREPASQNAQLGTAGLYQIPNEGSSADMNISGSITNRTGAITDLRFSGNSGITFLDSGERNKGKIRKDPIENVNGDTVSRLYPNEETNPVFLFQERNRIKLTWGYKEDKTSIRSEEFEMMIFKVNFPSEGHVKTTIIGYDSSPNLDKVAPTEKPIIFGNRVKLIQGDEVEFDEDITTSELVKKLCEQAGMPYLISPVIDVPLLDSGKRKVWFVGQSFDQFMRELARRHNAIYKVKIDPSTGKETLFFITKEDMKEFKITPPNRQYFTYKAPGSIILDITVNADFKELVGKATKAITQEKAKTNRINQVPVQQFENSDPNSFATSTTMPITGAAKSIQKNVMGEENPSASYTEVRPEEDVSNLEDMAQKVTNQLDERKVSLTMTTLGYTGLCGGSLDINGLGLRYSGTYQVRRVTHIIDNSGYICKTMADTLSTPSGGTSLPSTTQQQGAGEKVSLQQFEKSTGRKTTVDRNE